MDRGRGDGAVEEGMQHNDGNEYETSRTSRFRFKSAKRTTYHRQNSDLRDARDASRNNEREHRHHHRTKRRRQSPVAQPPDDPSLYDDTYLPNTSSKEYIDPDVAFRESLFDAMADDEGAQFWEGVYGQPVHTYPNVKEGPNGELERMTDEEYTAHIRAKMYEKTHQHLIEEKARRDAAKQEREKLAKESMIEAQAAEKFRRKVEESLKRGQERKSKKAWGEKWENYTKKWEELGKSGSKVHIASIPWPVESGHRKDIKLEQIERFFLHAPSSGQPTETQLGKVVKIERIRWHPDKIQQKLGGQDVDDTVIQAVTEVFQIIDRMWSDLRDRKT